MPITPHQTFAHLSRGAQFRDRIAVKVTASPAAVFRAFHEVTLSDMPIAWFVGELRYLPLRLMRRRRPAQRGRPFLSILKDGGTLVLGDDEPREIVFGSAGRLHQFVDQTPVRFDSRRAFDEFDESGYEKLFMSVRLEPIHGSNSHWLVLEHATEALSPDAERRFRRYWRVIKPMGAFVTRQLLSAVRDRAERGWRLRKRAA